MELAVETALRTSRPDLFAKYCLLKERLLSIEYEHTAAGFPEGNNHGRGHITRVLEYFDKLLGAEAVANGTVTHYEAFLAMMAILYHDVGILRARKDHAKISALLLGEERNDYVIHPLEKEVISAAVVSHSSSTKIEDACIQFENYHALGQEKVRPRLIAALVRMSDELDEDYRRADPRLESWLQIPEDSRFYWRFCQRIGGIHPEPPTREIVVHVRLEHEDLWAMSPVAGEPEPIHFFVFAAKKLAKINRERAYINGFLPAELQYRRLVVSMRPPRDHPDWREPRRAALSDDAAHGDLLRTYPELFFKPAGSRLQEALREFHEGRLSTAAIMLEDLSRVATYLDENLRLSVYYDRACIESRLAEGLLGEERSRRLDVSLEYLRKWIEDGLNRGWAASGKLPANEVHRMGSDGDLECLFVNRLGDVVALLPIELKRHAPSRAPDRPRSGFSCVVSGSQVATSNGPVPIEALREGDTVLSYASSPAATLLPTRVRRVHSRRVMACLRLNRELMVSEEQELLAASGRWIRASELRVGMSLQGLFGRDEPLTTIEALEGRFEVFDLGIDHETHNYIAGRFVCHNKVILDILERRFKLD